MSMIEENLNKSYGVATRKKTFYLLLPLSLVLIVMTNLRMSFLPIGPGEALLVIWISKELISLIINRSFSIDRRAGIIVRDFLIIFFVMHLGLISASLTSNYSIGEVIRSQFAHLLSILMLLILANPKHFTKLKDYVRTTIVLGTLIFFGLYLLYRYAGFTTIRIMYGGVRFTGGARNPNQLALFLVSLPFLVLYFLVEESRNTKKTSVFIFWTILLVIAINLGLATQSDGLYGTWILSVLILITVSIFANLKFPSSLMVMLVFFISILLILVINENYRLLQKFILDWFNELDEGGSRASLWVEGLKQTFKFPLFGLGPGSFIKLSTLQAESHNTFIDLALQGGYVALIIFMIMLGIIAKGVRKKPILITAFASLIIFSMSHYVLRQPIFWFICSAIVSLNINRTRSY